LYYFDVIIASLDSFNIDVPRKTSIKYGEYTSSNWFSLLKYTNEISIKVPVLNSANICTSRTGHDNLLWFARDRN